MGILRWFGLNIDQDTVKHTAMALLLNSIFFAGELFQLARGMTHIRYRWGETTTVKNLFWAPLYEEFIYRACLINVFIETGKYTPTYCVLLTPLFFAISHLHHVFEQ